MKKGTNGFTLVELIVVIAILAILAGIAIPVYSGYIAKANEAADYETLDAIKTAATFATIDHVHEAQISTISVAAANGVVGDITVTYSAGGTTSSFVLTGTEKTTYIGSSTLKSATFAAGATWNGTTWSAASAGSEG